MRRTLHSLKTTATRAALQSSFSTRCKNNMGDKALSGYKFIIIVSTAAVGITVLSSNTQVSASSAVSSSLELKEKLPSISHTHSSQRLKEKK